MASCTSLIYDENAALAVRKNNVADEFYKRMSRDQRFKKSASDMVEEERESLDSEPAVGTEREVGTINLYLKLIPYC
jgi:hypothetical protein